MGPEAMAVLLAAAATAYVAFGVATAARRTIGWAVASAVVAALIAPFVSVLDRWLPRPLAVGTVLFVVGAAGISVAGGILADLDNQYERLEREAPRAAAAIERSERLGALARDFRLEERVNEVLDRLRDPTAGLAAEVPARASTFFLCAVLTAFFVFWGRRLGRAALRQLSDERQRSRVEAVFGTGFRRAQRYALAAVARAVATGWVAFGLCWWEDVPAAIVVAVTVAAFSVIPGFGILVGALPALMLEGGLGTGNGVTRLALAFVVLQVVNEIVLRRVIRPWSLNIGPAGILIPMAVGFEVYGVGGAYYGTVLAVLGIALLDAAGEPQPPRSPSGGGGGDPGDRHLSPAGGQAAD